LCIGRSHGLEITVPSAAFPEKAVCAVPDGDGWLLSPESAASVTSSSGPGGMLVKWPGRFQAKRSGEDLGVEIEANARGTGARGRDEYTILLPVVPGYARDAAGFRLVVRRERNIAVEWKGRSDESTKATAFLAGPGAELNLAERNSKVSIKWIVPD